MTVTVQTSFFYFKFEFRELIKKNHFRADQCVIVWDIHDLCSSHDDPRG